MLFPLKNKYKNNYVKLTTAYCTSKNPYCIYMHVKFSKIHFHKMELSMLVYEQVKSGNCMLFSIL